MYTDRQPNLLIHESSPYLLQHAYNPVQWYPWSEAALEKARLENKPLLISIGYSACHWCHVMERECFEDDETAQIMNRYFVCIKVDREERPDIDQLYMAAVHLMGHRGGWPLNCFALPNGQPIYGGTYFPKKNWQNILHQIHKLYSESLDEVLDYAQRITLGIRHSELFKIPEKAEVLVKENIHIAVKNWMPDWDADWGGPDRAPKFPLPNNYLFLLRYAWYYSNKTAENHVHRTLEAMLCGGIYDQIGGGFARYSTDVFWKVPHFEKMLYDNAQLVAVYAEAYRWSGREMYRECVYDTLRFVERELCHSNGAFYSALDADSDGEEGLFYTWSEAELQQLSLAQLSLLDQTFVSGEDAMWEGRRILMRSNPTSYTAEQRVLCEALLVLRTKRNRPATDDKVILCWNAMMAAGFANAARWLNDAALLDPAKRNIDFIERNMVVSNNRLLRIWKNEKAHIDGFLEDYCWLAEACYALFEAGAGEEYLTKAVNWLQNALDQFPEAGSGLLYFTSEYQQEWVSRQLETSDNVMPASNSVLARLLYRLGALTANVDWIERSKIMLAAVQKEMKAYASGYSNWLNLALEHEWKSKSFIISGEQAEALTHALRPFYRPDVLLYHASDAESTWFKEKQHADLHLYPCEENFCSAPIHSAEAALQLIKHHPYA
jgi:uncharacterized protein YyaL (SSP411 family)